MRLVGAWVSDVANGAPQVRTSFNVYYLDSWVLHSSQIYLAVRINYMVSLQSIHPHTRQLNFTIPCHLIKVRICG